MDKEDTDYNYCPECGEQVKEYSKKCEECGVLFEKEKYHKSEYSNVQPVNKLFLLLIPQEDYIKYTGSTVIGGILKNIKIWI